MIITPFSLSNNQATKKVEVSKQKSKRISTILKHSKLISEKSFIHPNKYLFYFYDLKCVTLDGSSFSNVSARKQIPLEAEQSIS